MELNQRVEHTLLKTDATFDDIKRIGEETIQHGFRGICVPPYFVKQALRNRESDEYKIITVIDFPFGYSHTFSKAEAIKKAKDQGADGVDVVINYSAAINGDWSTLVDDMNTVVHKARMSDLEIKIIIELGAYPSRILKEIVEICKKARPDYVKTNTGMMGHQVQREHLKLLVSLLDGELPIKASGGIRSREEAEALIDIGAEILGASSAVKW